MLSSCPILVVSSVERFQGILISMILCPRVFAAGKILGKINVDDRPLQARIRNSKKLGCQIKGCAEHPSLFVHQKEQVIQ